MQVPVCGIETFAPAATDEIEPETLQEYTLLRAYYSKKPLHKERVKHLMTCWQVHCSFPSLRVICILI